MGQFTADEGDCKSGRTRAAHCAVQISQPAATRAKAKHVGHNAAPAQVYVSSGMLFGIKALRCLRLGSVRGFFLALCAKVEDNFIVTACNTILGE